MTQENIWERRAHIAERLARLGYVSSDDYKTIAQQYGCSVSSVINDIAYVKATRDGCTIYGLCDPDTNEIRYVGQTNGVPDYRLRRHLTAWRYGRDPNEAKVEWIKALEARGKTPALVILERCPASTLNERERWWINYYARSSGDLLNVTANPAAENGRKGGRPKRTE